MSDRKKNAGLLSDIQKRMGEPPKQSFLKEMLEDTPLKSKIIRLNLESIKPYERNPRWTRNPSYDEIKSSIMERGLDQPLVVTLRPGDRQYVLKKGGGTRYKILGELWKETGDKRFYEQEVVFESYKDEIELFTCHGVENLKRGNMSFIESAKFYIDLKQIYEDTNGRELSMRDACDYINREGFSIDPARLTRYTYALHLFKFIPLTLEAGAGRPVVDNIRRHEKTSREIWLQHSDNLEQFEQLWSEALALHDHEDPDLPFDLHGAQANFENTAGAILGVPPQHLSALVDLALHQPDCTAMSELSSGPNRSLTPLQRIEDTSASTSLSTSPVTSRTTENSLTAGCGQGVEESSEPVLSPQNFLPPEQHTNAQSASSLSTDSPTHAEPGATSVWNPAATTPSTCHGLLSLLPSHIQTDKGPSGGFEYLRVLVEQDLADWTTPRDQEPVYRAAKSVVVWANTLLSYFGVPSLPEAGDPPGQLSYVSLTDRQLHLRAPVRNLSGDHVFDHVWLRLSQVFYGPVLLERDQRGIDELTGLFECCCKVFALESNIEQPEWQLQRVIYLHTLSHLIFADPAHIWLDQALHALQLAARNYHIVRRQQADPIINPLGELSPDN